jgi:hypothetical protein
VFAQKTATKPLPIIFALINDGKTIEPVALIEKGKLVAPANGMDSGEKLAEFGKNYYKPKTRYQLVFGGIGHGFVTVNSANAESECGKNLAKTSFTATKAKIKGLVMGLATNAKLPENVSGLRRMPTPAERAEVEKLVRAEFVKNKVSANALKKLNYHNLTALDVNNDGKPEFVGSYYVTNSPKERSTLFFITEKNQNGKLYFGISQNEHFTPENVMSGQIEHLDEGIYHRLLLDVFDYDSDGISEIFIIAKAFEGNNFFVYRRQKGNWVQDYEFSNYHCAF